MLSLEIIQNYWEKIFTKKITPSENGSAENLCTSLSNEVRECLCFAGFPVCPPLLFRKSEFNAKNFEKNAFLSTHEMSLMKYLS